MNDYKYQYNPRLDVFKFLPDKYDTILEVGCGRGDFKSNIKSNVEMWGVEPNEYAAKQAEQNGYKVLSGFYDEVESDLPDNYFDLIICNDVIEHMVEYEIFLISIKKKLKTNGCIVGSIPNVRYCTNLLNLVIAKDWKYTNEGILDNTHLRFFTEKSLKRTLTNCEYSIEEFSGINSKLYVWFNAKNLIKFLLLVSLIVLTLGYFKDIQYMQFAFRIKTYNKK